MSRRKQSNPKPIKVDDEEEERLNQSASSLDEESTNEPESKKKGQGGNKLNKQSQGELEVNEEPNSAYECPVCGKALGSQHDFTLHIRLHNSGDHVTSHSCSLCGKVLSSASSLDRHMLVHSGERPFKCSQCSMAFTTNGNMHRHMRTHHGEGENQVRTHHGDEENNADEKRVRTAVKCIASPRDVEEDSPTKKFAPDIIKIESDAGSEKPNVTSVVNDLPETAGEHEVETLHCPLCNKTFLCKYGLQTHLETHPRVLRCQDCNLTFQNFRGLNRHRYLIHIKKPNGSNSQPVTVGFQDLNFIDFSSEKFAIVAKAQCEQNTRCPSSVFHIFECFDCKKAFPCGSALKMHCNSNHRENSTIFCQNCNLSFSDKKHLSRHLMEHCNVEYCQDDKNENISQVPCSNKENFFAVLGLQSSNSLTSSPQMPEEPYENPAYFTHGMPSMKTSSNNACNLQSALNNDNEDFADIQSILSLTSAPSLLSSMGNSPVVVTSASPRRGLVINPESPATADSATASPELPADISEQAAISLSSVTNGLNKGRFPCKLCPLVFPNLRALKGHNRSHLGISPYRCNMCSYTSIDKSTLFRHLRTHNGERPYLCTICQYAFTTKANCERHMRKRHGKLTKQEIANAMQLTPQAKDSSQISYYCHDTVCKYCNVDFKFYRVLRHHLRSLHSSCTRKPFQCKICNMGFSTKNNCYRHVIKQHPEKKDSMDNVIWTYASENEIDLDLDDNSNSVSEDATDIMESSMSPGPPLLDPVPPISENNLSDSDLSSVEQLVNWSTRNLADIPLQEEPLDLAVHPVDLSLKKAEFAPVPTVYHTKEPPKISRIASAMNCRPLPPPPPSLAVQSSPFISKGITHLYSSPSPINMCDNGTSGLSDLSKSPVPSVLNCTDGKSNDAPSNEPSTSSSPKNLVKANGNPDTIHKKQKQKRYRTERPFKCNHCEAGFTLRSNMERHIKQQHPEHWATRIRGRKPNLSMGVSTRPLLPRSTDSNPRPISNHVKEAISQQIRQRLAVTVCEDDSRPHSSTPPMSSAESSEKTRESDNNSEIQEPAQDLVSVSRLLDTANAQKIQEIFRESENSSYSQNSSSEEKVDMKRSAYTNAPHRVSCPFCARRFPWTSSLRRHILTHTGQKPFKCPHCPLLFTTKSNCDRHLIRKHGGVGSDPDTRSAPERPYRCSLCPNSAFSTPSNLRKHLQQKHGQDGGKIMWEEALDPSRSVKFALESENEMDPGDLNNSDDLHEDYLQIIQRDGSTSNDSCLSCNVCKSSFCNQEEYEDHVQLDCCEKMNITDSSCDEDNDSCLELDIHEDEDISDASSDDSVLRRRDTE